MGRVMEFKDHNVWVDTTSHSEQEIYEACVEIMTDLVGDFREWYESVHGEDAVKELPEDEIFGLYMNPQTLVRHLFLSRTDHQGATSARVKMDELGIDREWIEFGFQEEEELAPVEGDRA